MRTRSQQDPGKLKEKQLTEKVKDLEQLLQDVLQERDQERDTCSWKGQLERTRSWKVLSWKV